MAERKDTTFTSEHFAAWCEKMVGQPYWYGGVVYKCTQNLLDRKAKQYPAHYTSGRMKRYKDEIAKKKVCADCVGGCKGYAWTNGGVGVLEAIGIPVAYIGLIVAVDRLFDMGRTCLNVTGDIACSLCVTKWESKKK